MAELSFVPYEQVVDILCILGVGSWCTLVPQKQVVGVLCTLGVGSWHTLVLRQQVVDVLTNNYVPNRDTVRVVYILSKGNTANQFSLPHPEAELSASSGCAVCVSCSQYLFLPLAIVSECVGKLTAYLCMAAEGPTYM